MDSSVTRVDALCTKCMSNFDVSRFEKTMVPYGGKAGQKPTPLQVVPVCEKRFETLF